MDEFVLDSLEDILRQLHQKPLRSEFGVKEATALLHSLSRLPLLKVSDAFRASELRSHQVVQTLVLSMPRLASLLPHKAAEEALLFLMTLREGRQLQGLVVELAVRLASHVVLQEEAWGRSASPKKATDEDALARLRPFRLAASDPSLAFEKQLWEALLKGAFKQGPLTSERVASKTLECLSLAAETARRESLPLCQNVSLDISAMAALEVGSLLGRAWFISASSHALCACLLHLVKLQALDASVFHAAVEGLLAGAEFHSDKQLLLLLRTLSLCKTFFDSRLLPASAAEGGEAAEDSFSEGFNKRHVFYSEASKRLLRLLRLRVLARVETAPAQTVVSEAFALTGIYRPSEPFRKAFVRRCCNGLFRELGESDLRSSVAALHVLSKLGVGHGSAARFAVADALGKSLKSFSPLLFVSLVHVPFPQTLAAALACSSEARAAASAAANSVALHFLKIDENSSNISAAVLQGPQGRSVSRRLREGSLLLDDGSGGEAAAVEGTLNVDMGVSTLERMLGLGFADFAPSAVSALALALLRRRVWEESQSLEEEGEERRRGISFSDSALFLRAFSATRVNCPRSFKTRLLSRLSRGRDGFFIIPSFLRGASAAQLPFDVAGEFVGLSVSKAVLQEAFSGGGESAAKHLEFEAQSDGAASLSPPNKAALESPWRRALPSFVESSAGPLEKRKVDQSDERSLLQILLRDAASGAFSLQETPREMCRLFWSATAFAASSETEVSEDVMEIARRVSEFW